MRFFLSAILCLAAGAALGQPASCHRYQAELAALPRGGSKVMAAAAGRQKDEIGRMTGYVRQIGCDRAGAPPECGTMQGRLQRMEANYSKLLAQADTGNTDQRRRQLQAALAQACAAAAEPPRPRPVALAEKEPKPEPKLRPSLPPVALPAPRLVETGLVPKGSLVACVRSCDGYFFPLAKGPLSRKSADSLCQALCPGAETGAYTLASGDDGLARAVALRGGQAYPQTPNAFRFQKSLDASCSCKRADESWAALLSAAEAMVARRKDDILVTAETSEALSRPKAPALRAGLPAESDGIVATGTIARPAVGLFRQSEGETREGTGARRPVRVIAPRIIPIPEGR